MGKLRYLLFVLFYTIASNCFSVRGPECLDGVLLNESSVKIKMDKSRGDFYVAVLDSTALLTKNDFQNLSKLARSANEAFDVYCKNWKANHKIDKSLHGDSLRVADSIYTSEYYEIESHHAEFRDSVFASSFYKLYTHIVSNYKSVKCNEPNLYKYFAGSNPLTWQKSEDGVALFQDGLYFNGDYYELWHYPYIFDSHVRFVVYCPSEDWYYVSPVVSQPGKLVIDVPENKGADWNISYYDFHQDSIGISLFLTLIILLLVYVVSRLMSKWLMLYTPSTFKVIFPVFAVPYAYFSFELCREIRSDGVGIAFLIGLYLILILGIFQIMFFCGLKYPELDSIGDKEMHHTTKFLRCLGLVLAVHILTICVGSWIIVCVGHLVVSFLQFLMWR